MGIYSSGRWQRRLFDSAYTIGAVALASSVHFALGNQFIGHTPYLISMLAVLISATRGGLFQGIFATLLSFALEISLWGEWGWLRPTLDSYHFIETFFYLVEGIVISLLAEFYLNGRLALRHSQDRFQLLFDSMPVGAMIHYQDKIVAANQTLSDMFGYPLSEIYGGRPTSIVAPESMARATQQMALRATEPFRITGLRQNGTGFPVEVLCRDIEYQGKAMRVMVMRDLTDSLIARQRLEQMNELLEARVAERTTTLNATVADLRLALENVKALSGLLPICGSCKRIRDDDGYWSQVEDYISAHSTAEFSHSLCPECLARLRDEITARQRRQDDESPE